jgi:hypothetical protein
MATEPARFDEYNIQIEIIIVTPAMARQWLDEHNYVGQRHCRARHVTRLAAALEAGRFRERTTVIQFVALEDEYHLVDGQHTLEAIFKSGRSIPLTVIRERVTAISELRKIYSTFNRDLPRRPNEILAGLGLASRFHMRSTDIDLYYRSLRWVLGEFRIPSQATDIVIASDVGFVAAAMAEPRWLTAANLAFDVIAGAATSYLRRAMRRHDALAIMIATLTDDVADLPKARGIWQAVAADDGLRQGDPRKAIVNLLMQRGSGDARFHLLQLRSLATGYNAAYTGRRLQAAAPSFQGMVGLSLEGTSFRARRANVSKPEPAVAAPSALPPRRRGRQPKQETQQ